MMSEATVISTQATLTVYKEKSPPMWQGFILFT